ncbi:MAG: S1/P1 nuclease [Acidobacteria bacterium]|nr:S1/P1 nuclease [Acidobacteriota bacterium]
MHNFNSTPVRRIVSAAALLCLVLLTAPAASAWGAGGHMMTAKIAFDRLNPKAKAEAERLMAIVIEPADVTSKRLGFFRGSVWPDDVRSRPGFEFSGKLHFADFPFSVDSTPLPDLPEPENVIVALGRYVEVLKTSTDDNERAQALRFVIHFVGDIHQPLHCSTRVDETLPKGDQGGNLFLVLAPGRVKLHSFWDGGLNSFPKGGGPPDFEPPPQGLIDAAVPSIIKENPDTNHLLQLDNPTNFQGWADESSWLAEKYAYAGRKLVPESTITEGYKKDGVRIARRRVAWGGYRLAALLNSIWPG